MIKLDDKYLEFNDWLFCELLESRSNYTKAIKNNWNNELKNILKSHNEIIEEVWDKWENVYYHEK